MLLVAVPLAAQTPTVVNFDAPPCNGDGVRIYQGIDFTLSPWDCERANLQGDATETISWYVNNKSGKFRFIVPSVLMSLRASSSSGSGNISITTDANETVTIAAQPGVMPLAVNTGFVKPATIITVSFPGGWTVELDDLIYGPPPPPPPPTITGITVTCSSLAVTFGGTSNCSAVVTGTGAFDSGVTWTASDGLISAGGVFTAPSTVGVVTVTATSVQNSTQSAMATIVVSRPPISLSITLLWDDGTPISGTVQIQQMIGTVNTALTNLALDNNGVLNGPVTLDLTQTDPLIISLVLINPTGTQLGFIQENVPKAMFLGVTRAVASLTISRATMTIRGSSLVTQ